MYQGLYNNKTILVTGHTGFKGSWLSLWLKNLGAKVVGVSIDIPSTPSHFDAAQIGSHVEDHRIDIRDNHSLTALVEKVQPDFVFHLAAQALVRPSYADPLETIATNALGSANVLNALRSLSKPVVAVMITSDKAYDNVEWVWGYRETDRLGGKDPYSASKGMAELAIRTFVESYFSTPDSNVRVGITRAGNVIGGSGFIGSHTADELSDRGYHVTIFDHVQSPWIRDDQEMVVGSIMDKSALESVLSGARYVYHFAGIADIGESKSKPFDTINFNIMGTTMVSESAIASGVERLIYASTMYVYSTYGSFYRASKQATETIIEAYSDEFGLDYTFLRYGSLYGPRAQDWNGLKRYIKEVLRSKKMTYWGSGKERREYIHACDAARLSVDVLDDKHKNKAITVTGQQVLNAYELIDLIFEISGIDRSVEFTGSDDDHGHYVISPYRYIPRSSTKLVPDEFIDLGEGVLEVIDEIYSELDDCS